MDLVEEDNGWFSHRLCSNDLGYRYVLDTIAPSSSPHLSSVVQHYIYKTNPCGTQAATCRDADGNALVSPLNVWIQTGS